MQGGVEMNCLKLDIIFMVHFKGKYFLYNIKIQDWIVYVSNFSSFHWQKIEKLKFKQFVTNSPTHWLRQKTALLQFF